MTSPDYLAAAAALFHAFTFDRLIPLVTLLAMMGLFLWVLWSAQRREDFDAADFLREEPSGKMSFGRLAGFVCLITMTWVVFIRTLNDKLTVEELALFAVTWSGSLVLLQAINAWKGKQ